MVENAPPPTPSGVPESIWDKWTTPSSSIQDRLQRKQSQLFNQIVLVTLWTATFSSLLYGIFLQGESRIEFGIRSLPAFAFLGFCYLLGRSRWFLVGVFVMTGGLIVSGSTVIVLAQDSSVVATMLMLGFLGVVNAGATLPPWAIGLTGLGGVSNIALFSTRYSDVPKTPLFGMAAGMVILTTVYCWRAQVYQVETYDRRWAATRQMGWLRTLRESFDAARVPMCRISHDGYIDTANAALAQMFGVAMSGIIGSPLEAIGTPDNPMEHPLDLGPLLDGQTRRINTRRKYFHKNRDVLTAKVSVGIAGGEVTPAVMIACLEDITPFMDALEQREKRRLELQTLAAGRLEMLSLVNREIRNPLMGVVGSVDILNHSKLSEDQTEYLDIIQSSADSLVELMTETLEKGPIQTELTPGLVTVEVDLGALVEEVCRLCAVQAFGKGVELVCEIGDDVPRLVWAESAKLHQVIMAVIEDAIAHTDSGVVYCGVRTMTTGLLRTSLEMEVRHSLSGGVDPAFGDEFVDSLPDSLILSSGEDSTIRRVVASLGGTIDAATVEMDVSVVRIRFDWAVGTERVATRRVDHLEGRKIWVVVEPVLTQEVITRLLTRLGATVEAIGVVEFIDTVEQRLWEGAGVDTLLLDVGLTTTEGISVVERILDVNAPSRLQIVHVGSPVQTGTLARNMALYGGSQMVKPISSSRALTALTREWDNLAIDDDDLHPPEPTDYSESEGDVRILLVEDDPVHRRIIVKLLSQLGYCVEAVTDGGQALELYMSRRYDLVFMDCRLPYLDGLETTKKLRSLSGELARIPIIAMSANAMESEKKKCIEAGMNAFLAKPITKTMLMNALDEWLPS